MGTADGFLEAGRDAPLFQGQETGEHPFCQWPASGLYGFYLVSSPGFLFHSAILASQGKSLLSDKGKDSRF